MVPFWVWPILKGPKRETEAGAHPGAGLGVGLSQDLAHGLCLGVQGSYTQAISVLITHI